MLQIGSSADYMVARGPQACIVDMMYKAYTCEPILCVLSESVLYNLSRGLLGKEVGNRSGGLGFFSWSCLADRRLGLDWLASQCGHGLQSQLPLDVFWQ